MFLVVLSSHVESFFIVDLSEIISALLSKAAASKDNQDNLPVFPLHLRWQKRNGSIPGSYGPSILKSDIQMWRLVAAPVVEPWFRRHRRSALRAARCGGEQTGRRWDVCCWRRGGVGPKVLIYRRRSLSWEAVQPLRVCIISCSTRASRVPTQYLLLYPHGLCDNYDVVHSPVYSLATFNPPLFFTSCYIQNVRPLAIIIHASFLSLSDFLSFFLLLLSLYIQLLPVFVLLPSRLPVLSLSLSPSCSFEVWTKKAQNFPRETSHRLLVDFSFKFNFQTAFIHIKRIRINIKALQCKWGRPHLSQNRCCWGGRASA